MLERKARDRRKVSPTEFGRLLVSHAESVASELQNLKVQFDNLLGLRRTVLRFAATPTAMTRLIAPALAAFRTQHPKFRVQAMQMVLPKIISRLNEGVFDFIIADEPQEPLAEQYPRTLDHGFCSGHLWTETSSRHGGAIGNFGGGTGQATLDRLRALHADHGGILLNLRKDGLETSHTISRNKFVRTHHRGTANQSLSRGDATRAYSSSIA